MKRSFLAIVLILAGSIAFAQTYQTPAQAWQSQGTAQKFAAVTYLIAGYLSTFAGGDATKQLAAVNASYLLENGDSLVSISNAVVYGLDAYYGNPTHQFVPMFQAFADVWKQIAPGFKLP